MHTQGLCIGSLTLPVISSLRNSRPCVGGLEGDHPCRPDYAPQARETEERLGKTEKLRDARAVQV